MTATMNPTALFQHYVQNNFNIPKEIKHDIIYCQRALKAHIKVHQMVLDVYRTQQNPNPTEKQRIIDELETQIYEINAEQQFLFLRLRSIISEFQKILERKGVLVMPDLLNESISSELVPLINDQNLLIYPISVRLRCTEEKLIEKYFEVKTNEASSNYIEILDSDDEDQTENEITTTEKQKAQYKPNTKTISNEILSKSLDNVYEKRENSLLKPIAERRLQAERSKMSANKPRASEFLEINSNAFNENSKGFSAIAPNITVSTIKRKSEPSAASIYPVSISASKHATERENDDSSVSQNVKRSRLNLRQVLKNAQNGNLASKAAANNLSKAPTNENLPTKKESAPIKKPEQNNRSSPRTVGNSITLNSSSGESTPERCLTPPQASSIFPAESVDTRTNSEEYGQEMFLRIFGLFTPEMRLQMQQRRSKRKRRTVQSNERSDFHYGHIEYGSCAPAGDKKKRKAFLLSPQIKRKQGRPPKRRSVEKSDETTSRSGSSSPDEKHCCNECLKNEGTLESCKACKSYFHRTCHNVLEKTDISNKTKTVCPSCVRLLENETKQQQTLRASASKLRQRLTLESTRRKSLQQESKSFKLQMSMLFDIIKAIKSDPQSDSD